VAIRTSDAGEWGAARSRLRRSDIAHPFFGVSGADLDLETLVGRCSAYEPLLRDGQLFSHVTALGLHGAPLPPWLEEEPLHLAVLFPRTPPRGQGVRGHSLRRLSGAIHLGFPIAEAAHAWCQSAAILGREDLVAAGDALVTGPRIAGTRRPGITTRDRLAEAANALRGSPGSGRVAWALPRIRSGVDSRPETLLRLLCVRSRLPEPLVDHAIAVAGGLVLHADIAYADARIVLDYEGDVHRVDRATWLRDLQRRELFEDAGWRVIRVTSADLFGAPDAFVERLRALRRARIR
jgi:hypothetical protein